MDTLMDHMAVLPDLFERAGRLLMAGPSLARQYKARDLLEKFAAVESKFDKWYTELIQNNLQPMYWDRELAGPYAYGSPASGYASNCSSAYSPSNSCSTPSGSDIDEDPVFPVKYDFSSLRLCLLHLYYWSALLTLKCAVRIAYQIAESNYAPTPPASPESSDSTPSPPASTPASQSYSDVPELQTSPPIPLPPLDPRYEHPAVAILARNICKSIDYSLSQSMDSLGPDTSAFPLWVAMQYFDRTKMRGWKREDRPVSEGGKGVWDREMNWCREVAGRMKKSGWGFGEQMGRIEWDKYL
jgi:hypothetical protein